MAAPSPPLARFKKAWLREIAQYHRNLLWAHGLEAPPVAFALMAGQSVWGRWRPGARLLSVSEELILGHPWPAVLGIVGHETAHQLVTDFGPRGERPHGAAFGRMAERLGLDPFYARPCVDLKRESPCPGGELGPGQAEGAKVLEKVRKLLALGGSPVAAEAESAMNAAARLMARHNLKALAAGEGWAGGYESRVLKLGARRLDSRLTLIAKILSRHFFVETIFVPGYDPLTDDEGKDLELLGRPENTRLAEHTFHFLMERTETLWQRQRRLQRGGGQVARNSFINALLGSFCDKLDKNSAAFAPGGAGEGGFSALVLARDAGLRDYFRRRHPKIVRAYSRQRFYNPESAEAGRAAGAALNLNRPMEGRAGDPASPRLLGL